MYYDKMCDLRTKIINDMNGDVNKDYSMFILFWMFIGYFIKNVFGLCKVFIKGLFDFVCYGYYRLLVWCDTISEKEVHQK